MVVEAVNRGHTVRFGYEVRCARSPKKPSPCLSTLRARSPACAAHLAEGTSQQVDWADTSSLDHVAWHTLSEQLCEAD